MARTLEGLRLPGEQVLGEEELKYLRHRGGGRDNNEVRVCH